MVEQPTAFLNDRGERLVGTLLAPPPSAPAAAAPVPCVILAHGYMSGHNSELLLRLAGALAREGLASLRFDFSGNGDSEGRFRYGGYRSEADEIRCAREHVERAHGCRVVGLLGHSKGATDAIVFAGKYRGIPRVVNLAGRFDVSGGVERRLGTAVLRQLEEEGQVAMRGRSRARGEFTWLLTKGDLTDRLTTDVAAACAAIPADTRVLTVHGTDDADVPLPEAHKFAAAIRSHELLVVEGGDHTFSAMGALLQLVPPVVAFLKEGAA